MTTKTATKRKRARVARTATSAGALALAQPGQQLTGPTGMRLRVPYPIEWGANWGVTVERWKLLIELAWPAALTAEAVCLAWEYCRWRNLDPLKKMVHIVPVWAKDGGGYDAQQQPIGGMVETVWPGIAEIRITAARTKEYAGKDAMVFGPDVTETFTHTEPAKGNKPAETREKTVTYPEWAELTVYRMVQGQRCAFVGPKVKWKEAYATDGRWSKVPNEMWADRSQGQLDKCAEAAALRAAFPEELGGEHAAEEMYGRILDTVPRRVIPDLKPGEIRPDAHRSSEFSRPSPDAPQPAAAAPVALEVKPVDPDWFKARLADLEACTKVAQVGELCELVEQELPPESEELRTWTAAAQAKSAALLAVKPPAKKKRTRKKKAAAKPPVTP